MATIFKYIFLNGKVWILIKISLKCVPNGSINNIPALDQIMAWHWLGNKSLSEPMMVSLPTHIWVTWPQWINSLAPGKCSSNFKSANFKHIIQNYHFDTCFKIDIRCMPQNLTNKKSTLFQVMAWCKQATATSHYLSQCWPRSTSPYDVTRQQVFLSIFLRNC